MNQEVIRRDACHEMLGGPVVNLVPLTVATEVELQVAAIAVALPVAAIAVAQSLERVRLG